MFSLFFHLNRVFFAISFAGISLGQTSALLPDYAKAKHSAQLMIQLFNLEPRIDIYAESGIKPVSAIFGVEVVMLYDLSPRCEGYEHS